MTFTANPATALAARNARMLAEVTMPVYTSETPAPETPAERLLRIEDAGCTPDYCFVCGRATEHWGEHSEDQLLAWGDSPRGRWLMRA